jgi:hypothetical protein
MRIISKQRAICVGVVTAALAISGEALGFGRGGGVGAAPAAGMDAGGGIGVGVGAGKGVAALRGGATALRPTGGHAFAPGVGAGHAPTARFFAPAGPGPVVGHGPRYGEFGLYGRHRRDGWGGGYWGGGGVFYGDPYYDPNFEVGPAAAGASSYDPNYEIGSGEPGYYDAYAHGRPTVLTALPPVAPDYGLPAQRIVEVPVTVTRTPVQTVAPPPAFNPHIIELEPAQ